MVKGLDIFSEYFKDFTGNYVIIGGTACDLLISEARLEPRATKDIDIILIVEALSSTFVKQFWKFVKDGEYMRQETSEGERIYYRFMKPANPEFPSQLELFSRKPELIILDKDAHLTPIPTDEDLSSLSAILMDNDYYDYLIKKSTPHYGLQLANINALICLKARAFLEMTERKAQGGQDDDRQIRKHKYDVFRLAILLREDESFELPLTIRADMEGFLKAISGTLPDESIYKAMGIGKIRSEVIFNRILDTFSISV